MDTQDPIMDNIYKLMDENKFEEAKSEINKLVEANLSKEERGEALTEMTMTYMTIMTDLNKRYVEYIDQRLRALDQIDDLDAKNDKKIELIKTRQQIMDS